jgi:hypothetical protein
MRVAVRLIAVALLAGLGGACAPVPASIVRYRDGFEEQVVIVDSDARSYYTRTGGQTTEIERTRVEDVFYPGPGLIAGGALGVLGGGLLFFAVIDADSCEGVGCAPYLLPLTLAVVSFGSGMKMYRTAKDRAEWTGEEPRFVTRPAERRIPKPIRTAADAGAATMPAEVPAACEALVASDRKSLMAHGAGVAGPDCSVAQLDGITRKVVDGEIFGIVGFSDAHSGPVLLVKDRNGQRGSTPCLCLAPR